MDERELQQRIQSGSFLPLALTIEPLQKILLDIMALIKRQNEKFAELEGKIAAKADKPAIDSLAKELEKLRGDVSGIERELRQDFDRKLGELANTTAENNRVLNDRVGKAEKTVGQLADSVANMGEKVGELNATVEKVADKVSKYDGALQDLGDRLKEAEKQLVKANSDIKDLSGNAAQMGEKLNNLDKLTTNAPAGNSILLGEIEALKGELDRLKSEGSLGAGNFFGESGLSAPPLGSSAPPPEISVPPPEISAPPPEISAPPPEISAPPPESSTREAGQGSGDSDARLSSLEEKVRALAGQLDRLRAEAGAKLSQHDQQIADLRSRLDALGQRVDGLGKKVDGLEQKVDRLSDRVDSIGRKLDSFGNRLDALAQKVKENGTGSVFQPRPPVEDETSRGRRPVIPQRPAIPALGEDGSDTSQRTDRDSARSDKAGTSGAGASGADGADGQNANAAAIEALTKEVADLRSKVEQILRDLADRPDRLLVERLFDKFKTSLANVADMIKRGQNEDKNFATMDDIRRLEQLMGGMHQDFEEAAAARKSTCCLSCGRPYRIVTGSITDEQTMAVLGAAPISHVTTEGKPCFVYGSDHELYYSSSPRGRTFVAPASGQPRIKAKQ